MATVEHDAESVDWPEAQDMTPRADAGERLVTLDFIRGIAVMGILFCNIVAFAEPQVAYAWPNGMLHAPSASDKGVWLFQYMFFDGRFRGLFTVLFGAGMMLFMERAWARGAGRGLQARRLLWLMMFGLAHFFLLWRGDILVLYAFWGLIALSFVEWRAVHQLRLGLLGAVVGALMITGFMGQDYHRVTHPEAAATMAPEDRKELFGLEAKQRKEAARDATIYRDGSWPEMVRYHTVDHGKDVLDGLMIGIFETLPLMLLGMGLYRVGFFSGALDPGKMGKWGWTGLVVGGLVSIPFGIITLQANFPFHLTMFLFTGPPQLGRIAMTLGMAALFVVWAPAAAKGWLGERVVAAGRMAFSNYLGTSLMMAMAFNGWGLGLFGKLDRVGLIAVVLTAWAAMLIWSPLWLGRFRFGPLEWAWRCLTYWRRFPLRR